MKILNIKIYNGSEWIDYTLDSLSDLNIKNGEGLGSIKSSNLNDDDRPYTEDELPIASGHEAWAFGKGCKATAKRAISWGNRVKNSGNTAVSFGQIVENTASLALIQGGTIYNGGAAAAIVGTNIHNKDNPTSSVMNNGGGAAAALFGTYLYNRGSHSLTSGYLLSNSKPVGVSFGFANEDKATSVFEIGRGPKLSTVDQATKTFVFKGLATKNITYTVIYKDGKPYQLQFPNDEALNPEERGLVLTIGPKNWVETSGGKPVYIIDIQGTLFVYEARNIFEIDERGKVSAIGGLDISNKALGYGARILMTSDGFEINGKVQSNGKVSGDTGEFAHGLNVATRGLAKFQVYDDGAKVTGNLTVTNPPSRPTDVVRLTELDGLISIVTTADIDALFA